ncbi:hypothetical protein DY000_02054581 [Brassica cretica]|uniref:Uncharacterized protein n=1 Tax=Brassica cretica TaxID=69181 RepID=A0ABQ7AK01_BRACR|nr:hypothetical protein DY000_02054581 [Brassica cretica]
MLLFLHLNSVLGLSLESHLFFLILASLLSLISSFSSWNMDSYPYSVELSSTQVPFLAIQGTADSAFDGDTPADRWERRTWTPSVRTVVILQHLKQILRSIHGVLKPQRREVRRRLIKRSKWSLRGFGQSSRRKWKLRNACLR